MQRIPSWVLGALSLGGLVAIGVLAVIPLSVIDGLPVFCLSRIVLGVRCPGCGMTQAMAHLLHGDFTAAVARNHLVVAVGPASAAA